ncbi:MAG: hypothetical protein ABIQ44_16095 [Chloroflexia bacterium]
MADKQSQEKPEPDVAATLAELREQIRERRARFTMSDPNDPHALNLAELKKSVEAVNDSWFVSAHLPITWETRIVGRLGAYTKRLARLLLRWYINPIIEQQNRLNSAVARTLVEMAAYNERLTREWQTLEERVEVLEEEVRNRKSEIRS